MKKILIPLVLICSSCVYIPPAQNPANLNGIWEDVIYEDEVIIDDNEITWIKATNYERDQYDNLLEEDIVIPEWIRESDGEGKLTLVRTDKLTLDYTLSGHPYHVDFFRK